MFLQNTKPLILTLSLNETAAAFFNDMRQTYFPAERNFLAAHLTLFHHLPPAESLIEDTLETVRQKQRSFLLQVTAPVSIGKGVAYKIVCPELVAFHKTLQTAWKPWLIPQDRQTLWPHVTVQNKVSPAVAQSTLQHLQKDFTPFEAHGHQLSLWSYEGGPWQFLQHFPLLG